ncbi:hypothetical protein DAEQUDRAFT_724575 [Daedalea quercina L-15889]|uniref:Uncharacterized protein n=1 Tax=Daedalea quercina L-15889 TaxID=1314783 RepID=A0A165RV40_9APHY|nr:hypothetical protein DAEQUDRAFT_724575 [Daedalea quercina L-15889]
MSGSASQSSEDLRLLEASLVSGLVLQWGLLGVLCLQCNAYVSSAANVVRRHKITVYAILLLEWVQSIGLAYQIIGLALSLPVVDMFAFTIYTVSPISTATAQVFYAKRVIQLSRRHNWTWVIGAVCAFEIAAGIITGVAVTLLSEPPYNDRRGPPFRVIFCIWCSLTIAANLLIVVSMSIMYRKGRWNCHRQSISIITRLFVFGVQSGSVMTGIYVFTVITGLGPNIALSGFPDSLVMLSKVSACTLLACLNNPMLSGEGMYHNVDLIMDDTAKAETHENARSGANHERGMIGSSSV